MNFCFFLLCFFTPINQPEFNVLLGYPRQLRNFGHCHPRQLRSYGHFQPPPLHQLIGNYWGYLSWDYSDFSKVSCRTWNAKQSNSGLCQWLDLKRNLSLSQHLTWFSWSFVHQACGKSLWTQFAESFQANHYLSLRSKHRWRELFKLNIFDLCFQKSFFHFKRIIDTSHRNLGSPGTFWSGYMHRYRSWLACRYPKWWLWSKI